MATNKTDFLGLNDWIGTDPFKRDEFNANFRALEAKAKEHEDTIGSLSKDANEYEWTSVAGQLTYVLPAGQTYDTTTKWFEVTVGGAPVPLSQIQMDSSTQFTLLVDAASIPAGLTVVARWTEPSVPATAGHHTKHEAGGADEIDITKLKNFNEQVVAPLADITKYVKPTGTSDDTDVVNAALSTYNNIVFKNGTFNIDVNRIVSLRDNMVLTWEPNAIFKVILNSLDRYEVLDITSVKNITLNSPNIVGDKYDRVRVNWNSNTSYSVGAIVYANETGTTRIYQCLTAGTSGSTMPTSTSASFTDGTVTWKYLSNEGQWGHGIQIKNAQNITVNNANVSKCFGDGIYINKSKNVRIEKPLCDDNRRQGISLTSGENVTINNPTCSNTGGQNPGAGIDIEPNDTTDYFRNVNIYNPILVNNGIGCAYDYGISIALKVLYDPTIKTDVQLNIYNPIIKTGSLSIETRYGAKGYLNIYNAQIENSWKNGLYLLRNDSTDLKIFIDKPSIKNPNTSGLSSAYTNGICLECETQITGFKGFKNIVINEPTLTNENASCTAIRLRDEFTQLVDNPFQNCKIVNPRISGNFTEILRCYSSANTLLDSSFFFNINEHVPKFSISNASSIYGRYTRTNLYYSGTTDATVYINEDLAICDAEIRIENRTDKVLKLQFGDSTTPTTRSMCPFNASAGISLTGKYSSVKFKKISATEYLIMESRGTIATY